MLISSDLPLETDEYKSAVASDSHLRLMLQLVSFERTFDDIGESLHLQRSRCVYVGRSWLIMTAETESWFIPAKVLPSNLTTSIGALRQYLLDPPSLSADPKSLIQKKRKRKPRLDRGLETNDEDLNGDGEPAPHRQRKKKVAEVQNYKSAAFIDDSDDSDAEADLAFFEKERQLRERMMRMAEEQAGEIMKQVHERRGKAKGKGKGKGKENEVGLDEDGDQRVMTPDGSDAELEADREGEESEVDSASDSDSEDGRAGRRRKRRRFSQVIQPDESEEEDAPARRGPISNEMIDSDSD